MDERVQDSVSGRGAASLARRLIELHGGTIHAHGNGPGKGAEFSVRLPTAQAASRASDDSSPKGGSSTRPRPVRILLVDDNVDSAESLGLLLQTLGNEVRIAHDGLEALERAKEQPPELVLLDLGLPKLDGYEVAREIRRLPWGAATVLVALTGWGQDEDRRRSAEAGFDHHLVKPVDTAQLRAILASVQGSG